MVAGAYSVVLFFFQAEDGIRDLTVTGVQTCALPISREFRPADLAHRRLQIFAQLDADHLRRAAEMRQGDLDVREQLLERLRALPFVRSEEHTSELQSQSNLVCRLLLEKKNISSPDAIESRMRSTTSRRSTVRSRSRSFCMRRKSSGVRVVGSSIDTGVHPPALLDDAIR